MHLKHDSINRRASFVLRIWWEPGEATPLWRGQVQHVPSGSSRYFQTTDDLLYFVELYVGPLATKQCGIEADE